MMQKQYKINETANNNDPAALLHTAIQKLDTFTQPNLDSSLLHIHNLEIKDGCLVATQATSVKRVVDLTRCFIGSLFSDYIHQEQVKKKDRIQQEILQAVDVIKSYYPLIEKLKKGDVNQQHLADYALEVIQRYNQIAEQKKEEGSWVSRFAHYIYQRSQLTIDAGVTGRRIEPSRIFSLEEESSHPAYKTIKELSITLSPDALKKINPISSSKQKKTMQVMVDTFRLKVNRLLKNEISHPALLRELLQIAKETPLEIEDSIAVGEESAPDPIEIQQNLEVIPGLSLVLKGIFKSDPTAKLMSIPSLQLSLTSQINQSGFPYASQQSGWVLSSLLVDPYPLREDQSPIFYDLEQHRKKTADLLRDNPTSICQERNLLKIRKQVFNENRAEFLNLHKQLSLLLLNASNKEPKSNETVLNYFYDYLLASDSPFDLLSYTNNYLNHHLVKIPAKKLQEEWLAGNNSSLRTDQPEEKFKAAQQIICAEIERVRKELDPSNQAQRYILVMSETLAEASKSIILQYLSEKIGFVPPMLNDFEQKMQACAFQQQINFTEETLSAHNQPSEDLKRSVHSRLERTLKETLALFESENLDETQGIAYALVNELEVYFNSRYYISYCKNNK